MVNSAAFLPIPPVTTSPWVSSPVSFADYMVPPERWCKFKRPKRTSRVVAAQQLWECSDMRGLESSVSGILRWGASESLVSVSCISVKSEGQVCCAGEAV